MSKKIKIWPVGNYPIDVTIKGGSAPSDTYSKAEIDNMILRINSELLHIRQNTYNKIELDSKLDAINTSINDKTSAEAHYLKNKEQLKSGEYIALVKNDDTKTITFNQSTVPIPTEPINEKFYSYDADKNDWIVYTPKTIGALQGDITGTYVNTLEPDATNPDSKLNVSFSRERFNEPLVIGKNAEPIENILANCTNFNQSINLANVNWNNIPNGFLYQCSSFNSNITFNNKIKYIGDGFLQGCPSFNKSLNGLITNLIETIGSDFLSGCSSFNQPLPFESCNYLRSVGNSFLSGCSSLDQKIDLCNTQLSDIGGAYFIYGLSKLTKLIVINSTIYWILKAKASVVGFEYCFASKNDSDPVYVAGIHIKILPVNGSVVSEEEFKSTFPDRTTEPYRKSVITN